MKNKKKVIFELFTILIGGLFFVAAIWLFYALIYNGLESIFYANDPLSFPADQLRLGAALLFFAVYVLTFRIIKPPLLSATIAVAPVSMLFIMIILNLYTRLYIGIPAIAIIMALMVFGLVKIKARWFYYLSVTYSLVIAIAYAWPR